VLVTQSGYGKQRCLTTGRYLLVWLELARKKADEILLKIESGDDPSGTSPISLSTIGAPSCPGKRNWTNHSSYNRRAISSKIAMRRVSTSLVLGGFIFAPPRF